jgi:hypothetical protein
MAISGQVQMAASGQIYLSADIGERIVLGEGGQ